MRITNKETKETREVDTPLVRDNPKDPYSWLTPEQIAEAARKVKDK